MEHFTSQSPLAGMKPGEFQALGAGIKKRLRRLISQCCEKAFRRGFQQGFESSNRGDEVVDLLAWRFLVRSDISPSPHARWAYSCDAVHRLDMECDLYLVGLGRDRE